jgi:hypothetical protein
LLIGPAGALDQVEMEDTLVMEDILMAALGTVPVRRAAYMDQTPCRVPRAPCRSRDPPAMVPL